MAGSSAPAAAVLRVEVRVVERLYDVAPRRRVTGTQAAPRVELDRAAPGLGAQRRGDTIDETGAVIDRPGAIMPGVYQVVRTTGADAGMRTFSRARARAPRDLWIYAFVSPDVGGSTMTLAGEWWADDAGLHAVDLRTQIGNDLRSASGVAQAALLLEWCTPVTNVTRTFWFLCSQHQIPWASLSAMEASGKALASRCHRLMDEMWTDARVAGGPPRTMWEHADALRTGSVTGFVVYVVDPLMEAATRAVRYATALDAWLVELRRLAQDDEYRLAKRIEIIPPPHADLVAGRLGHYLVVEEREARRRLDLALELFDDLLRWIGREQRRDRIGQPLDGKLVVADTWYRGDGVVGASLVAKTDDAWTNPFSAQVRDFAHHTTPPSTYVAVANLVSFVHARLRDLPDGLAFMRAMLVAADTGKLPVADGGAGMLFECHRKLATGIAEVVAAVVEFYGPVIVAQYRKQALPKLAALALDRKLVRLAENYRFKALRTKRWRARKTHRRLEAEGVEALAEYYALEVDVPRARQLAMTSKGLNRLVVAVELINLQASLVAFADDPGSWNAMGLLGSSIDAYSAVAKLYPQIGAASIRIGGVSHTVKIAPALAYVSSSIDIVMGARDAIAARNAGQRGAHVMRTMGACLTLGGAVAGATPWGAVMTIVGVTLQSLGAWIASLSDDLQVFLRHCRWGEPNRIDSVVAVFSDANGFDYDKSLDSLRDDVAAQLRALDWLMFRFDPSFEVFDGTGALVTSLLMLKMNPPEGLGPCSRWTVALEVVERASRRVMKRYDWSSAEDADNLEISANTELVVLDCPAMVSDGRARMGARFGEITVRGTIVLDVLGDGRETVTRRVRRDFDLPW